MDITGTLVSFRGSLEKHYLGTAKKLGVEIPEDAPISQAFKMAYTEQSLIHPCFGGHNITAKEWWKGCVLRSFDLVGAKMTPEQQEHVFQRIYSIFGSQACYEKFEDAIPFLHWAQRKNLVCGVLSNADERYGDSILPMLGFTHDELNFQCYSKDLEVEKPDRQAFMDAMTNAQPWLPSDDPLLPSEVIHVGNDYFKDFEGARRAGMHAVLLDRYEETESAEEYRRRGALCFSSLTEVVEFLGRSGCKLG
jgi:putative hydrolase of the HAD superfamily